MVRERKNLQRELIPGRPAATTREPQESGVRRIATSMLAMRRKAATFLLIAFSIGIGLYALFGHDGIVAYRHKREESLRLHQQILNTQQENKRMATENQRLKNDPDTIEYQAREQLHYTRPGEVIYTLPKAPKAASHK